MIGLAVLFAAIVVFVLGVEIWRWNMRPEQRRLRVIRKIGRR